MSLRKRTLLLISLALLCMVAFLYLISHFASNVGEVNVSNTLWTPVVLGLAFGLVTLLYVETRILARIALLSRSVARIAATGDLSTRVDVPGNDELSGLGTSMNDMLGALNLSQTALEQQYSIAERARGETRAILDASSEAMILISPAGRVLTVNSRFSEFFQLEASEVVGAAFGKIRRRLVPLFETQSMIYEIMAGTIPDERTTFTQTLKQSLPQKRELELYSAPAHSEHAEPLGRLYVFRDVTRERAIDRMKTEFIALVSHELRTPLTSIKGFIELLLSGKADDLTENQRRFLVIVHDNSERLVVLINDLLDVSRIESGNLDLKFGVLDFGAVVHAVVTSLQPLIDSKQHLVELDLPEALPLVWGDKDRVAQILTNLMSNACKYTPTGGRISLSVRVDADRMRVSVVDSGVGMTTEEQGHLFTRFFRAENPLAEDTSGTGLGLNIARSLVQKHGGDINVVTAPGEGSTFEFTLPIAGHGGPTGIAHSA
jgi:PAS domain S-box-containing protein